MPRLAPQHYRVLVKTFVKAGFIIKRTRGSHIIMNKPGVDRPVIIPKYEEVDVDIIKANLRTAQLTREEFFQLLED